MKRIFRRLSILAVSSFLAITTGILLSSTSAHASQGASSPSALGAADGDGERTITVARAIQPSNGGPVCVTKLIGTYGLDQFTRIALSSEITYSTESSTGMKAFSLILRGLGVYHDRFPQYRPGVPSPEVPFCPNVQPFYYDISSAPARVAFTPYFSSAHEVDGGKGNVGNKPNDRATDTMGTYMQPRINGVDVPLYAFRA